MFTKNIQRKSAGFTLMELLIAIAIVAILAGIAVPTYLHYTKKAYYSEVVQTADRYKVAIAACLEQREGTLDDCNAGAYGIPANITAGVGQVTSATVANSVVTVTPTATHGIVAEETYILTPVYSVNGITWGVTGGGCKSGLAPNC
jgi:prepilin-type N-terminal cleavage/methylation domain-containing protein